MAKDLSTQSYDGMPDATVAQVQKLFDKYDLDRNCQLSASEFRKVLVAVGLRDVDANKVYAKVDANNNGMVDMREFIRWLFKETPDFDTERGELAADRMGKIHKHMERSNMTKAEQMTDFFEFMEGLKEEYKVATKRDVVCLEKDLRTLKSGKEEDSRDCRLRDFFKTMDLNGNGKLTMSEFAGGMSAFGHDGDHAMMQNIFRAIDQEKNQTRVWDRRYHQLKAEEDAEELKGKQVYLVPACEIFEKRDMKKWNEDRAEAIREAMGTDEENVKGAIAKRKEQEKGQKRLIADIAKMEEKIAGKKVTNAKEDEEDETQLRSWNRELVEAENLIESARIQINQARFHYTITKHKDGLLDFNEFKKAFETATKPPDAADAAAAP